MKALTGFQQALSLKQKTFYSTPFQICLIKSTPLGGQIPEQWKVSKITPTFKKGDKTCIENYRPIANLCSTSKVFEKLILTNDFGA